MKGHTVAHSGQYQCQQCKRMFKTLGTLDDHIKNYHILQSQHNTNVNNVIQHLMPNTS